MKQVGFWYSDAEPTFPWPLPQKEKWVGQDEFLLNLAWIEAVYWNELVKVQKASKVWNDDFEARQITGKPSIPFWQYNSLTPRWQFIYQFIEHYRGSSTCRCCGESNGYREFRIEDWCWPEGLMHYVKEHNVEPPEDFKQWVLEKTFTGPYIPERELFEAVSDEDAAFIKQASKFGKTEYRLSFTGSAFGNPLFVGRYGKPDVPRADGGEMYQRAMYFDSAEDREMFKAQVTEFLKLLPKFYNTLEWTESEGPLVRKRTVAVLSLLYKGKEYEITKDYGYGYEGHYAIFDWEENNASCDCVRRDAIDEAYPGVFDSSELEEDLCGDGSYPVTKFRIEYRD
jgi:hypothetical protein